MTNICQKNVVSCRAVRGYSESTEALSLNIQRLNFGKKRRYNMQGTARMGLLLNCPNSLLGGVLSTDVPLQWSR